MFKLRRGHKACIWKWTLAAGIGLGIALKYLSKGDDVVLVGRSLERLESAIPKEFQSKGKPFFLAKDVSIVRPLMALHEVGKLCLYMPVTEVQTISPCCCSWKAAEGS